MYARRANIAVAFRLRVNAVCESRYSDQEFMRLASCTRVYTRTHGNRQHCEKTGILTLGAALFHENVGFVRNI